VHRVKVGFLKRLLTVVDHLRGDVTTGGGNGFHAVEKFGTGPPLHIVVEHLRYVYRHQRQYRDFIVDEVVEKVFRENKPVQGQGGPFVEGTKNLVQAVIEIEDQQTGNNVVPLQLQVLGHYTRGIYQVPVRYDNTLWCSRQSK
jgi:hypothetical protein